MKKINLLILSGVAMILGGLTILLSSEIGVHNSKIITPLFFAASGIFSILFANANKELAVPKNFHLLQGIGMIVFAVVLVTIPKSLKSFLMVATYFTMAYGLLEIFFTFSVLNSDKKINKSIMMARIITGVLSLIGGFSLFISAVGRTPETGVLIAGILISLAGSSFVIFARKVKNL